jgi:hypothetical protein
MPLPVLPEDARATTEERNGLSKRHDLVTTLGGCSVNLLLKFHYTSAQLLNLCFKLEHLTNSLQAHSGIRQLGDAL